MKHTILMLISLIPSTVFGQSTKKITNSETNETYYVLKSDQSIKHGEYKKYSFNKKLLVKGFYENGVRDSIWDCFNFNKELTLQYDFSNSKLIFYKPYDKVNGKKYSLVDKKNYSDTILDRQPIFLGGDDFITSEMLKNLNYPIAAVNNGKSGKVFVKFVVDKNGKPNNFHVDDPLGFGLDEESIRVMKLLPDNWLPGLKDGKPVDVEVTYPIKFQLQK